MNSSLSITVPNDGTYELLQAYTDPRIRLLRNDANIGACGNWNRLLHEFSGRYIKILCADDLIYPACLERQVAVLEAADQSVVMVSCGRHIIDEQGKTVFRRRFPGNGGRVTGHQAIRKVVSHAGNIIGEAATVLIRREAISGAGEFDGSLPYVIDLDYWVRVLQQGDLFVMNEYLAAFRISSTSWSVSITGSQTENFSAFIDKIRHYYGIALSPFDVLNGKVMSRINTQLRRIFYRICLGRTVTGKQA